LRRDLADDTYAAAFRDRFSFDHFAGAISNTSSSATPGPTPAAGRTTTV
jgi:hypothetical protein